MANEMRIAHPAPLWFRKVDRTLRSAITWFTCTLIVLMVAFTVYTVVMRYVFSNPPFWGDTVSMFCNIWLVLLAYGLAIRDREDIASEAIYELLPQRMVKILQLTWQVVTVLFGAFLVWFGVVAAMDVPGQYWELGGLPKSVPMLALPICGALVAVMMAFTLLEDILGWDGNAAHGECSPSSRSSEPHPSTS